MDNPLIASHIAQLKDEDSSVRQSATEALIKIGIPAVPALIEALKAKDALVRGRAVEAIVQIGDVSAVPTLIETLKDEDFSVRRSAAAALGRIGDMSAVPALIEALKDEAPIVRRRAGAALGEIGDSDTLPRKILADSRCSAQERINVLERLRSVDYKDGSMTLRYTFPKTRILCQAVLNEQNAEAREGARAVLHCLDLLRATHRDTTAEAQTLLRVPQDRPDETPADTLLRAADKLEQEGEPPPTLLQRLFGKRKGTAT